MPKTVKIKFIIGGLYSMKYDYKFSTVKSARVRVSELNFRRIMEKARRDV
ncbi:MAG: hypothetical protein QXI36_04870 [Candidatus Bathyarchaeia archaeon]